MALKAGDIIFGLKADDTELKQALGTVKESFAKTSRAVGQAMTVAGAAITGFAALSVTGFTKSADAIGKMSDRTGLTVDTLSRLSFAAEQGGGNIDNLEKGTRNFSRVLVDAQQGLASAQDTLALLGYTVDDYAGKNPDQIFMMTAEAIANIQDPTLRAAAAMEAWGSRAGTSLLPALKGGVAGLRELMATAPRVFTEEDTQRAADFNDRMNELKLSGLALADEIARALVPSSTDFISATKQAVDSVREWVKANPELVASIVQIVTVMGGIMTAIGPILIALPGLATAFSGVSAAIGAVVAALGVIVGAISAPVAAIVAAIAAIVAAGVALVYYWDEVKTALKAAWEFIANAWWTVWGPIIEAIKWLANTGLGLLDKVGSFFGSRGNGALNQDALDRYNNNQPRTSNRGGIGDTGGGLGGGVNINNMTVVTNNPELASRDIAENLYDNLRAAGVAL